MMREQRRLHGVEMRARTDEGRHIVTLHAITPDVVDDYGSVWMADAFDESATVRLPTLCWAHDWSEPLGPGLEYRAGKDGPEIDFALSDFDAVPMARRAFAQVEDGTIRDCSVGFTNVQRRDPTESERKKWVGVREVIEKATLDEVSLVLAGAVPGAKVLAIRSSHGVRQVSEEFVISLGKQIVAGELTHAEADAALALAAGVEPTKPVVESDPETIALADDALASLGF